MFGSIYGNKVNNKKHVYVHACSVIVSLDLRKVFRLFVSMVTQCQYLMEHTRLMYLSWLLVKSAYCPSELCQLHTLHGFKSGMLLKITKANNAIHPNWHHYQKELEQTIATRLTVTYHINWKFSQLRSSQNKATHSKVFGRCLVQPRATKSVKWTPTFLQKMTKPMTSFLLLKLTDMQQK